MYKKYLYNKLKEYQSDLVIEDITIIDRLIIFLDIDGVIATHDSLDEVWLAYTGKTWDEVDDMKAYLDSKQLTWPSVSCDDWPFDRKAIHRLQLFQRDFPAQVEYVISSSWRTGRTLEEMDQLFTHKGLRLTKIIGKTGRAKTRGAEILNWLKKYDEESTPYIIIDDECSYDITNPDKEDQINESLCVQTPFKDGINEDKLVELFQKAHIAVKKSNN